MNMFSIEFSRKSEKFIGSLQKDMCRRIITAIDSLKTEPFPRGAIKVRGEADTFRIRVGDYRILYEVYAGRSLILIAKIDKRSRAYENF